MKSPNTTTTSHSKPASAKEKARWKEQKAARLRKILLQGYTSIFEAEYPLCIRSEDGHTNHLASEAMQTSIRMFKEKPKAKQTRIYLRLRIVGKGKRRTTNERVCVVPSLVVKPSHWVGGGLTNAAPIEQRLQLDMINKRIAELQTDLTSTPRRLTPAMVKAWIWPEPLDLWPRLQKACFSIGKEGTRKAYYAGLTRFFRYCGDVQPSGALYATWCKSMTKDPKLGARSSHLYRAGVRSLFDAVDLPCPRKVEKKKVEQAKVCAITTGELSTVLALQLSGRLAVVRDAFVCACLSALRVSDWHYFTNANVGHEVVNRKTGKRTLLPAHPIIVELIQRNGGAIVLPSTRPNLAIKKIMQLAAEVCPSLLVEVQYGSGTRQKWNAITSHSARRTFATLGYMNGATAAQLQAITGHSDPKQLMDYVRPIIAAQTALNEANATSALVFTMPDHLSPLRKVK